MSRNLWTLSSSSSWCTVKVCSMVILLEYSYCCYCWLIFVTSGLLSLFYCKIVLYLAHWMCHLITQTGTLISDDEVSFFFYHYYLWCTFSMKVTLTEIHCCPLHFRLVSLRASQPGKFPIPSTCRTYFLSSFHSCSIKGIFSVSIKLLMLRKQSIL